ncbi:hypothetical protein AVEN_239583-1 [Araneus ventricosus]|uniref:Uncharacterized protein n=1 Tax=Araneus ventricosus TaxID=182803 RepID=A0A4Y2LWZ6_ARAVE|nr:hypothetical protein AVEN_239583-1 [Araneus ventricosus]
MQFLPYFEGLPKTTKNLRVLRLDFAPKSYPVPIARGFVRRLQHSGETSVNDRKVKGSGLDRDLCTVPTGSCNCVCFLVDADLMKNVDATGESSVCSLVHRDKVRCPSATELWDTVWKGNHRPDQLFGLGTRHSWKQISVRHK